jgi:hypothetical protein
MLLHRPLLRRARNRALVPVEAKPRFLRIGKLLSDLPKSRKTDGDNSMSLKGKTRIPSNRSVSQSNLGMVKAKLPESQGQAV